MVEQQKQRHDDRQHTVEQQPAGAEDEPARPGEDDDLDDTGDEHEKPEDDARGHRRDVLVAQAVDTGGDKQRAGDNAENTHGS